MKHLKLFEKFDTTNLQPLKNVEIGKDVIWYSEYREGKNKSSIVRIDSEPSGSIDSGAGSQRVDISHKLPSGRYKRGGMVRVDELYELDSTISENLEYRSKLFKVDDFIEFIQISSPEYINIKDLEMYVDRWSMQIK
jgi:hypothetical protein